MERQYDLVIVGAGPAGLSAALYGSRAGLKTLILENGAPGGKLIKTNKISNYPGIKDIEGTQLAMDMFEQATSFQAEYAYGEVNKIDENKNVYLNDGNVVKGKAVILATGTKERLLNIPGENENLGHGVSFCAVCDGAFFRDKEVVVIGGGNSALEESIYLAGLARSVTIVIRRDVFRAEEHIQKQIEENAKIHVIKKHIPVQILSSEGKVSGIELENVDTHEKQVIECSGIFPYVGQDPNTDCVQDLGILNERGYVLVDDDRQTKIPGIYAAGDVIDKNLRQVITACNDGAIAAQHAFHKIKGRENRTETDCRIRQYRKPAGTYRPAERRTENESGNQPRDDNLLQIPCHHQNRCSHSARHGFARPRRTERRGTPQDFRGVGIPHTHRSGTQKGKRQFVLPYSNLSGTRPLCRDSVCPAANLHSRKQRPDSRRFVCKFCGRGDGHF